jgi:serine/threonine protein phosphatase 1
VKNIYIIIDVHGCYKTLLALIDQFLNKQKSKIVFVGDLIDKGKNTYDVIEFVKNNNHDCVKSFLLRIKKHNYSKPINMTFLLNL